MKGCKHAGCRLKHSSHGYCSAHAAQWSRRGYTWEIGQREPERIVVRLNRKVEIVGTCRVWRGSVMKNGYGTVSWQGKPWLVHRAVWTEQRGPIPDGLTIDHLCRIRACINVDHMEVVTIGENARRGGGSQVSAANRRAKNRCKNGHERTPENTRVRPDGSRCCRECERRYSLEWLDRSGRRKPRVLKPCGTVAAYERHRQRGEQCPECRAAKAAAERQRRAGYRTVEAEEVG